MMFKFLSRNFSSTPIYNNICETIGNTPVVRINRLGPKNINLFVKCEYFNPLSSVKDRLAIGIIEDAENRGIISPNDPNKNTVIEATSGNTGIALAMVCAQRGYKYIAVMTETFSIERRKIMRALGAKVILTPAKESGYGMIKKAQELSAKHGWYLTHQFENDANPNYHASTTGPEILEAFGSNNINLDYFVTGYGTGGTFQGAGRVLKAAKPDIKIILCEPANAPLVKSGVKQERDNNNNGAPLSGHSEWTPHPIQGWTPNFIPKITEEGKDKYNLLDKIITVKGDDAMKCAMDLAKYEGIFTGVSGGATVSGALDICQNDAKEGSNVLAMLPDTMERYMSTPLFASILAEMNDEEVEISKTTPSCLME